MAFIWKDALEFDDFGGWSEETQFAHEMGQGYLMAIEVPGVPVKNARTALTIETPGMYRFWVRTKNWLPEYSPGRFRLLVDGNRLPREMGKLPTEQWSWDTAGDVQLESGSHRLEVEDTSGYFSRFASILVTDDMDYTPLHRVEDVRRERALLRGEAAEPVNEGDWDILVAGAGPAGIPAAVAAARKGMRVLLLHSRPGLGGNAASEAGVGFDGAYSTHPGMRETGIAEEIRRLHDFNHWNWEQALTRLVEQEPNLTVSRNKFVMSADVVKNVIRSVTALDVRRCSLHTYSARIYIDCTGDGWLGYHAGARYRLGREPKWQYQERYAPDTPDNLTMSGCIMGSCKGQQVLSYYAEDAGEPVPFSAPRWAVKLPDGSDLHRTPHRLHTGEWWIENPTDVDDLWEQEKVRDELLRLSLGYFDWLKNTYEKRNLVRNLKMVAFPRYNAKRETRRLIGDYVLTQGDIDAARVFPDAIAYCGWPLDVHHPKGLFSGKEGPFYSNDRVPITTIPYRCIYSKNIENLFMAGRCASVSHIALGTVRIENTLATLGQAAGTAAALCLAMQVTPRQIHEQHMQQLRQILLRDDQYIPGLKNNDPADLVRQAKITATSFSKNEPFHMRRGLPGEWHALDTPRAMATSNDPQPEFVSIWIRNDQAKDSELTVEVIGLAVRNRFEETVLIDRVVVPVKAGFSGWLKVPAQTKTDLPHIGVRLPAQKGFSWRSFNYTSFASVRGWPLTAWDWYCDHSNSYCAVFRTFDDPNADCRPEQVATGVSRIIDANHYGWVSDPDQKLPQSLEVSWDSPQTIACVALTFDTDLNNPAYSYLSAPVVIKTVKDYQLEWFDGRSWQLLAHETGNILRYRRHTFDPIETRQLRLTVLATHGDPSARVFEVRTYSDPIALSVAPMA